MKVYINNTKYSYVDTFRNNKLNDIIFEFITKQSHNKQSYSTKHARHIYNFLCLSPSNTRKQNKKRCARAHLDYSSKMVIHIHLLLKVVTIENNLMQKLHCRYR